MGDIPCFYQRMSKDFLCLYRLLIEKGDVKMNGGCAMRTINYVKPNMTNLKGKKGRAVLAEIRNAKSRPMDDIKRDADACMNRILARRKNEQK